MGARLNQFNGKHHGGSGHAADEQSATIIGMPVRQRDPFIGRVIGHFRLVRKIAEGGMGTIYLAKHTAGGQLAAVKLLLPEYAQNQEVVRRFFNEAKAAMSIQHPGVVEVYGFGYDIHANAYIVMEYLDGETLEQRVARQRSLPAPAALAIARQIADVLGAAHAAGIVHRDLKPDNIVLAQDSCAPGGEAVKLLDFGVAKLATAQPMTAIGDLMGTPVYMAPEQCRGAVNVDHRSDLYALGCLLYRMVCGRPPFDGANVSQVMLGHVHGTVKPPRSIEPTIPESLEALILGLLEKDPDDRPDSAQEVASALRDLEQKIARQFGSQIGPHHAVPVARPDHRGHHSGRTPAPMLAYGSQPHGARHDSGGVPVPVARHHSGFTFDDQTASVQYREPRPAATWRMWVAVAIAGLAVTGGLTWLVTSLL